MPINFSKIMKKEGYMIKLEKSILNLKDLIKEEDSVVFQVVGSVDSQEEDLEDSQVEVSI